MALMPVALFDEHRSHVNDILRAHGLTAPIHDGMRVRIHGRVDVHAARGRVQLKMDGIDPAYAPKPAISERDDLLRRLHAEGLLRRNAEARMPVMPLRVGLVTALNSAACADVCRVLHRSGYAFELVAADTPVQGRAAAAAIARAVDSAATRAEVVLLTRGGGSKADLAAFDHELVARTVALCSRPVFTGIGHQVDRSVADEVAHTSCATPTAAAAAVVEAVTLWFGSPRATRAGHQGPQPAAPQRSTAPHRRRRQATDTQRCVSTAPQPHPSQPLTATADPHKPTTDPQRHQIPRRRAGTTASTRPRKRPTARMVNHPPRRRHTAAVRRRRAHRRHAPDPSRRRRTDQHRRLEPSRRVDRLIEHTDTAGLQIRRRVVPGSGRDCALSRRHRRRSCLGC